MLDTLSPPPELTLEPHLVKGDLVPDGWWVTPEEKRQSFLRRHWLFLVTFVLPVALASIYYGLIAADLYTSETQFIVRSSAQTEVGNLASLMAGQKISRATDETYAVGEYMVSRDAMGSLLRDNNLRAVFARPQADFINRYPNFLSRDKEEELYRHYKRYVNIENDPDSGISTLTVFAFTPEDARDIATALVKDGEALVNRLNMRAYQDTLQFTTKLVEEQKNALVKSEQDLTAFRNAEQIVDPSKELMASFTAIATMSTELMEMQAEYAQKAAITAAAPTLAPLRQKITAYQEQIEKARQKIAGSGTSIATKLADYERLVLTRELAAKGLELAIVHMTSARQDAEQQRLYLETIVRPNMADQALHPYRILMILAVMAGSLCIFVITRAFINAALEHRA